MENILGVTKKTFVFMCQGCLNPQQTLTTLLAVIEAAGMTPAYSPAIYPYPWKGQGGEGHTVMQPLTESFIVADTYTRLGHTQITLSTCKPERVNIKEVIDILERDLGPSSLEGTIP